MLGLGLIHDAFSATWCRNAFLSSPGRNLKDRVLGFIYLDAKSEDMSFDAGHLHMLVIIASIAATVLENARHLLALERENQRLRDEVDVQHPMVGESPQMSEVYQFIAKVARSDSTILLLGESGTGKELVARAIHQNSPRSQQPHRSVQARLRIRLLTKDAWRPHRQGEKKPAARAPGKSRTCATQCWNASPLNERSL